MFGLTKKHTITLNITGMHCPKCQKKVSDALNGVKGAKAEVDLEAAKAVVTCPESVTAGELIAAVKSVGFEAAI